MFTNRLIWIFAFLLALTGCVTVTIPETYNFKVKELQSNPFGCWMEVNANTTSSKSNITLISGELLNLSQDSTYLLVADGMARSMANNSIVSANLYTHRNQSGTYLTTAGIMSVPSILGILAESEYADGFLIIGLPIILVGVVHAAIESNKQRNVLVYPQKNSLDDLAAFARYPGGIPENIDFRLLYLKR